MKIILSRSGNCVCSPGCALRSAPTEAASSAANGSAMAPQVPTVTCSLTRAPTFPFPLSAPCPGGATPALSGQKSNYCQYCHWHSPVPDGHVAAAPQSSSAPSWEAGYAASSAKSHVLSERTASNFISRRVNERDAGDADVACLATRRAQWPDSRRLCRRAASAREGMESEENRSPACAVGSQAHFPLRATLSEALALDPGMEMRDHPGADRNQQHPAADLGVARRVIKEASGFLYSDDRPATTFYRVPSSDRSSSSSKYREELEVAMKAVHLASQLTERVQERLIREEEKARTKEDRSLVTVADYGVQAVIAWVLTTAFPNDTIQMIAEEDMASLKGRPGVGILQRVVAAVNECLADAESVGYQRPSHPLATVDVLKAIGKGSSDGGPKGRYWVLDPVDGTLGFVRGDQYAIALAMIEDGEVKLGVLGCPNLPMRRKWLDYHHRYYRMATKMFPPVAGTWHKGCVIGARRGGGGPSMEPLVGRKGRFTLEEAKKMGRVINVSQADDPKDATFCEPVEKRNTSHSLTAGVASSLGMTNQPLRVYSMAKYATIARGNAEIFMKFANASYKEKVWDHAAGVVIVEEAGGVVTDAGGKPLDFSKGRHLEGLDRGIIASCGAELHTKILAAVDASWDSSRL
ncbi:hypothetical protein CBR_g427 [Chara braunii]|uniref:3'(2'),5'-bisphosphate nucleotidase n=1 Tax=Chara braunii TaxID=69332 RepID=A0A388JQJ8_CHABU|nr:hypothetical protein CBR_g427 [Chara braunii]|eukprot:GBG60096.1 hypothetical protein CBR_g427 [Chara braunii]